jgi:hypothetical protein
MGFDPGLAVESGDNGELEGSDPTAHPALVNMTQTIPNSMHNTRNLAFSILASPIPALKTRRELTVFPKSRMILPHPHKLDNRSN